MLCNSVTEHTAEGYILRVRLQPNSSSCQIKGIINLPDGDFLKISVCSIPEKGKANKELLAFLAKKLKLAKSDMEIVSGETDRNKKILIKYTGNDIMEKIELLADYMEK